MNRTMSRTKKTDAGSTKKDTSPTALLEPIGWNHSETLVRDDDRGGERVATPKVLHEGISFNHSETLVRG